MLGIFSIYFRRNIHFCCLFSNIFITTDMGKDTKHQISYHKWFVRMTTLNCSGCRTIVLQGIQMFYMEISSQET